MTTALAISKKDVIVRTEEMTYPVEYREEKPIVPTAFVDLVKRNTAKELSGTKSEMFNQYAQELQKIEKYHRQLREFMNDVCECNMMTELPTDILLNTHEDYGKLYEVLGYGSDTLKITRDLSMRDGAAGRGEGKSPFPVHLDFRKKPKYKQLLKVHFESRLKELPDLSFQTPGTGRAELAAQADLQIIKDALEKTLKKCWAYLIWMTLQSFDYLISQEMMGVIEWHASDVARYNYFTGTWMERQVRQRSETHTDTEEVVGGTTHTRFTKLERDMERTYTLTRHIHDVIDAKRVLPSTVKMPFKARRVADRVPDYLKEMVEVVTGNLVFQQEMQEEILRDEWTVKSNNETRWFESNRTLYHADPALIIGHYVITGWV